MLSGVVEATDRYIDYIRVFGEYTGDRRTATTTKITRSV
ncbi:uncharacterized protein METZ01_LOCUS76185 [marine metagenome]|uniref:Uncharacterized protein n=1 Tax=marine metagenome TaxID=408172 RepID=A0A381U6E7_9ZZZZ